MQGKYQKSPYITHCNYRKHVLMNCTKLLFLFASICLFQGVSYSQEWISYQSQQKVNDLVDTGSELLLATDAGLVIMNKSTFDKTVINSANSNLSNNHIQSITQGFNGDTWIGTYDVVLGRLNGNDVEDVTTPQHVNYNAELTELYDFKIAPNGDFWLATSDGVFHRHDQDWFHYDQEEFGDDFFQAWDIEINSDGEVLIASHEVYQYANGEWYNLSPEEGISAYNDADLFYSSNGDLYFSGDLGLIGRYDGETWQTYPIDFNGAEVIGFTEDPNGSIYFNSLRDGIFKLVDDNWEQVDNAQTSNYNNQSNYFHIDAEGRQWLNHNIYLSVNDEGSLQSTTISPYTIEYNYIQEIHKGIEGNIYFINPTGNKIAYVTPQGAWSSLAVPNTLAPFEGINDLLFRAADDIWVAASQGLHHFNGTEWTLIELETCRSFKVDTQGKIYVRANDRIYIIQGDDISEYNTSNSPISNLIISGHGIDANNNLWIAAFSWEGDNAIQMVTPDGIWTTYQQSEYPIIDGRPSGDFHFDLEGNVWIPRDLNGAIKFDGISFTNPIVENSDDITNTNVSSITSDAEGKLYFSHQYGVTTLLNEEWDNLLIEDIPNVFSSHDSNIQFDDDGTLWWASSRYGVFAYSSKTTTSVIDAEADLAANLSVYPNPTAGATTLAFTISNSAEATVSVYNQFGQQLSYMSLGQLPAGTFQQTINLADLPKGLYTIQLQVSDQFAVQRIITH